MDCSKIIGMMKNRSREKFEKCGEVQLLVEDRIFNCEMKPLSDISEHLRTIFNSKDFVERHIIGHKPVRLHGIKASAFDRLLDCMFTDELRVSEYNVLKLLVLNDLLKLQPDDFRRECLQFIENRSVMHKPISRALRLFCFARSRGEDSLVHILSAHIFEHLDYFSMNGRLLDLSFGNLKALLVYLGDHILPVYRSSLVLLAIIHNWIHYREERSKYRCELMGSIKFSKIIGSMEGYWRSYDDIRLNAQCWRRDYEKHSDVQILVDGRYFKCRRLSLAFISEFFDTTFSSNRRRHSRINLDGIDAAAFDEFIDCMFTGELHVDDNNVLQLLVLNDFLKLWLNDFKDKCLEFVKNRSRKSPPMSNALDLLCFARSKGEDELVNIVSAHICGHLDHFSKDVRLVDFSFDNLKTLLIYARDYILPSHRLSLTLLAIIHKWINWNPEGRSKYRCELLGSIEFPKIIGSMWSHSRDDYEKHCDLQLTVGGRIFKCQRASLAVISEHLDTMFSSSDFGESNASPDQPITMPGIDVAAFDKLLDCMFTGDLHVDESNVLQLLILNDFLKLRPNDVKDKCLEFVKNRRNSHPMSNALDLFFFAGSKKESVLFTKSISHICEHLYHFSKDARFVQISFENLKELLSYAKSIFLSLPVSSNVLLAIIHNWVNYDRKYRNSYRSALLESIEPSVMSSDWKVSHGLDITSDLGILLIMRLENAVDEMELSKHSHSTSESRPLKIILDPGVIGGRARLRATIPLNLRNITSGTFREAFSPFYTIAHLSWIVFVEKIAECLRICIKCDGSHLPVKWNCHASAFYTIKSHKVGTNVLLADKSFHSLFSSELPEKSGCFTYLVFEDVINPENGFIVDDSITIHALVQADVPFSPDNREQIL